MSVLPVSVIIAQRDGREIQGIFWVNLHTYCDGPLSILDDIFYVNVNEHHKRRQRDKYPKYSENRNIEFIPFPLKAKH